MIRNVPKLNFQHISYDSANNYYYICRMVYNDKNRQNNI